MSSPSDFSLQIDFSSDFSSGLIQGVMIGMAVVDGSRTILQANDPFCEFLGYAQQELVGTTIDALTHPDDLDLTRRTFRILQADGDPSHAYEKRYRRKDGSTVWSLTSVHRLATDSPDDLALYIGFIQDITPQKIIEEQLRSTQVLYQSLVENIGVGLCLTDRNHRILMVNTTVAEMFDKKPADFSGRHCFQEFEKRSEICPHCPGAITMATGMPQATVTEGVQEDGSRFKVRVKTFPVLNGEGTAAGFVELIEDLSPQLRMETALQESEDRFRRIFEKSAVGMLVVSRNGRIFDANPAFCAFVGFTPDELKGRHVDQLAQSEDAELELGPDSCRDRESDIVGQYRFKHKDGITVWGEVTGLCIPGGRDGEGLGIRIIQDITKKKTAQARLDYLAHHDQLTGLPNQKLLKDRLSHAIAKAKGGQGQVWVMLIGLDRFTKIIGTFDHRTGDRILCRIAERLQETVRQADTLARFGDTEFVLVLEDVEKLKTTRVVAQNILRCIAEPIPVGESSLHITASLGISLYPEDGEDDESLLRSASAAMNRAKQQGGDLFEYFIPQLNVQTRDLIRMEAALRKSLQDEEFVLHYQPQIDMHSRAVVGFEALVRLQHPTRGLVPPAEFIAVAEETGVIVPMGEWILRRACLQNMEWQRAGLPPVRMSVNISPRQFRRVDLPVLVRRILAETGHPPEYLELEITESMVMDDVERAIEVMKEITGMGVHLAIDDFGSGYSSLHYLKRFPVHRLKVDRSFVKDVTTDGNDAAIASAVVALAKIMNLDVVAEGIETEEQLAFFLEKGCEFCQGYLFSKPLDAARATVYLARHGAAGLPS